MFYCEVEIILIFIESLNCVGLFYLLGSTLNQILLGFFLVNTFFFDGLN
jgi:hypothetical protein